MKSTRLGDVVTVKSGFAFKSADWLDVGVPVIKIANVKDGWVTLDGCSFVSEAVAHSARAFELTKGDVLISMTGHIGQVAKVRDEGRMLLNQRVGRFSIKDRERIDGEYLFQWLRLPEVRAVFEVHAYGAAQPNISPSLIEQQSIPLPPLPAQRRIASILSAYDNLIENNTRRIAILEEMARRIYEEWFVRFRFPGYEGVRMVESELGLVPEGWRQVTLADVCESVEDGDWIETKDQGGDDYRLLQISNVGVNRFVETGNLRFISQETFKRLRCREVLPGQLLIARMPTPIGRAWLVTPQPWKMVTAVDVAIATAETSKTTPEFLLHFLNSDATLASFATQASGTTRLRITRRQIAAMPLLAPQPALADHFARIARPMNDLAAVHSRRNDVLRTTRDLLLPKLISGELDVSAMPEPEALAA